MILKIFYGFSNSLRFKLEISPLLLYGVIRAKAGRAVVVAKQVRRPIDSFMSLLGKTEFRKSEFTYRNAQLTNVFLVMLVSTLFGSFLSVLNLSRSLSP